MQSREVWISKFEKPKTSPNSIDPSTTVLSMYLSHGCLSHRKFWHGLCRVYDKRGGSSPPVSLKVSIFTILILTDTVANACINRGTVRRRCKILLPRPPRGSVSGSSLPRRLVALLAAHLTFIFIASDE